MISRLTSLFHKQSSLFACTTLVALLWTTAPVQGQNKVAATCTEIDGAAFTTAEGAWTPLAIGDTVDQDTRVLALFRTKLLSKNKTVQAMLLGDIGVHGLLPVLEAEARILPPGDADLAVELERGILVLENGRASGDAHVSLTHHGEPINITLKGPGARLGIEVYGRHAPGKACFKTDDPTTFLLMLATKGSVALAHKDKTLVLREPPGPAFLRWDSVSREATVEFLQELPDAVLKKDQWLKDLKMLAVPAKKLAQPKLDNAARGKLLRALQASDSKTDRIVAVTAMGAFDDLDGLIGALGDEKHADVRDQAIVVMRNWLGRQPGQVTKFVAFLQKTKDLPEGICHSFVHLLNGFDNDELAAPQTFDLLIALLDHKRLGVRTLAHWHLVRLAPAGSMIGYDPTGTAEQRQTAVQAWRRLIPEGQVPATTKQPAPQTNSN